jgi:hypothetical protein
LLVQTKVIGASEGIRVDSDTELRVLLIARNGEILCMPESSSTGGKGATWDMDERSDDERPGATVTGAQGVRVVVVEQWQVHWVVWVCD